MCTEAKEVVEIIPNLRVRRIFCRTHPLPHPLLQRKMRRTRKFGMISNAIQDI